MHCGLFVRSIVIVWTDRRTKSTRYDNTMSSRIPPPKQNRTLLTFYFDLQCNGNFRFDVNTKMLRDTIEYLMGTQ